MDVQSDVQSKSNRNLGGIPDFFRWIPHPAIGGFSNADLSRSSYIQVTPLLQGRETTPFMPLLPLAIRQGPRNQVTASKSEQLVFCRCCRYEAALITLNVAAHPKSEDPKTARLLQLLLVDPWSLLPNKNSSMHPRTNHVHMIPKQNSGKVSHHGPCLDNSIEKGRWLVTSMPRSYFRAWSLHWSRTY